jgi:hypothetical protein
LPLGKPYKVRGESNAKLGRSSTVVWIEARVIANKRHFGFV